MIKPVPIAQVVASGAGGRRFETRPCHTKGVKNGTSGYLAWRSALQHYKASTGFSHSLLTHQWFTGTRLMSPSGVKTYRKIAIDK